MGDFTLDRGSAMTTYKKLVTVILVLVSACGGGGGGSGAGTSGGANGNSLPPTAGPGDTSNYFPTASGSSWNYSATVTNPLSGAPPNFLDSVTVTTTKAVDGVNASVFLEANPSGSGTPVEGYYYKNAGGIAYLGTNDPTDTVTPAITPYEVALFPVTPGTIASFSKTGVNFGKDLDKDGINETVDLTVTTAITGVDPLSIGIGSFASAIKSTETLSGNVILSSNKQQIPFNSSITRWSVPGAGILKTTQSTTVQSTTTTETMVARGYSDGTTAHGFGLPFTIQTGVAPADSNYSGVGPAALATDGQNFFAVSATTHGMMAHLFNAQGASLATPTLPTGSAPIASFDSTQSQYWLIYLTAGSGNPINCVAQRLNGSGTLIDTTPIVLIASATTIGDHGVAFGASNGLLAYVQFNSSTSVYDLGALLLNLDGTIAHSITIAADGTQHAGPAVAFDGTNYLVVWSQAPSSGSSMSHIYGARISAASGTVLDASPIQISTAPNGQFSPALAFDGAHYLGVWLDLRAQTVQTGVPYMEIYGARIQTDGTLLDGAAATGGIAIATGGAQERYSPYIGFSGTEYLVAWTTLGYANTGSPGVQAARLTPSGTLPSSLNVLIPVSGPPSSTTVSQLVYPVIASSARSAAVVWLDNAEVSGAQKSLSGSIFFPF
jgi:hypothetical protein